MSDGITFGMGVFVSLWVMMFFGVSAMQIGKANPADTTREKSRPKS